MGQELPAICRLKEGSHLIGRYSALLGTFALLLATGAPAQNPAGSLRGSIQDTTHARIADASVEVRLSGSSISRSASSNAQGQFLIEGLAPGIWHVTATAAGFSPAIADVSVAVSSARNLVVTLRPSRVNQTVGVAAAASSIATQTIDVSSSVHQSIVTREDLELFPLPARSFANIAYLAPGTEPVEPSDPTKARITAVSTGGSSGLNNELSVDGGDDSDDFIGGFLQNFSPDSVQEFAIRTGQEEADTGGTTAGSVVISTRSGGNQFHGSAAAYERAAALNARYPIENPAPNPKQPFSRQNYVGTIGGPILKDKVWFFVAFETVQENASIAYSPASVTSSKPLRRWRPRDLFRASTRLPCLQTYLFRFATTSVRCGSTGPSRPARNGCCALQTTPTRPIMIWCSRGRCPRPACSLTTTT